MESGHREAGSFAQRCYRLLQRVPRGRVTTYKLLAQALGCRGYRAVGNAMNRNPYAPAVPCHRVVKSDGRVGGFARGSAKKAALLRKEGIVVRNGRIENLPRVLHRF